MIRLAEKTDLPAILEVYQIARKFMADHGNAIQWGDSYPPVSLVESDIEKKQLYVMTEQEQIHGVFMFYIGPEPDYAIIEKGQWKNPAPYGVVHRVASDGTMKGMLGQCLDYCKKQYGHLRMDTHEKNLVMQHLLEKNGCERCGIVYMADGTPRIGYEWNEILETRKETWSDQL